jgi:hypothetical protein
MLIKMKFGVVAASHLKTAMITPATATVLHANERMEHDLVIDGLSAIVLTSVFCLASS